MRRLWRGIALALLLGVAAPVLATEPLDLAKKKAADKTASSGSWWSSWFGRKERPEDKKTSAAPEKPTPQLSPAESVARLRQREEDAYWRRNEVCLRLKQLAQQAGDEEQVQRIEQLEERNFSIFQQRLASLENGRSSELDEATLEQNLNTLGRKPALLQTDSAGGKASRAGVFGKGDK